MTTAFASDGDDHRKRLEELLALLRRLDPDASLGAPDDAVSVRFRARQADFRARFLAAQLAEHDRGRDDLTAALDAIIGRAPARLRPTRLPRPATPRFDPNDVFWSPTPILGFRGWHVRDGRLHGAVRPWPTPIHHAGCVKRGRQDVAPAIDVPHTNGECGRPACGIYATKEPGPIVDMFIDLGGAVAVGIVELSGKVVEHEYGYRAGVAMAVAMVVVAGSRAVVVDRSHAGTLFPDRSPMDGLFADPHPFVERALRGAVVGPESLRDMLLGLRTGYEGRRAA